MPAPPRLLTTFVDDVRRALDGHGIAQARLVLTSSVPVLRLVRSV